jgi:glycosyltransferase involved in cell wall biosynthesis
MSGRKLLFYTHALAGGGAERVMALLASGFAERGDDVLFVCDWRSEANAAYLSSKARYLVLDKGHVGSLAALAALLRRERPDVAMSGIGVSNLKLFLAGLASGSLGRCVQSVHGFFHSEPQLLSRIGYLAIPLSSRLTARTVAVSQGLADYIVGWGSSRRRTRMIYNPALTRPLFPTAAPLEERPPVVLSAGRFTTYKNFPRLVRAFAKLRTPDARLVILGEGDERPAIEAAIRACGLEGRVELPGYDPEPWRWYGEARCFASSANSEAFGLVVVEALASGLPVVSTATHGPSEILNDAALGALVPIDDEDALAQAIDAALTRPGDPEPRLARAARFSLEAAVDAYGALFDEVIARTPARRDEPRLASA